MFSCFQCTTKKKEVPLVGTLFTGLFTAIIAFFMTLDILADAISIGTLMAFNIVCAGVMVVRYTRGPGHYTPLIIIVVFVISTFLSAISFVRGFPILFTGFFSAISLLLVIPLCLMPMHNMPKTFVCPLVPLVPCIGIAINMYMLSGLRAESWIRLGVWLLIGLCVYFTYGIYTSKMRDYKDHEDDHQRSVNMCPADTVKSDEEKSLL